MKNHLGVHIKLIFTAFTVILFSLWSSALPMSFGFPTDPPNTASCFKAAQTWLEDQMWSPKIDSNSIRSDFYEALSKCTWAVPDSKNFRWPSGREYLANSPHHSLLGKTPDGDWLVAASAGPLNDSSTVQHLRISKDGKLIRIYSTVRGNYFWGYDFAAYDIPKLGRAIGVLTVNIYARASTLILNLTVGDEKSGQNVMQENKTWLRESEDKSGWLYTQSIFKFAPDPENDQPQILKVDSTKKGSNLTDLKENKHVSKLERKTTPLRWNGHGFSDQMPTDHLIDVAGAKNPVKLPPLMTKRNESKPQEISGVKFKNIEMTRAPTLGSPPKLRAPVDTLKYFEILSGVDSAARNEINLLGQSYAGEFGKETIDPETDPKDPKNFYYAESSLELRLIGIFKKVLTLQKVTVQQPPFNRSYDEAIYMFFDLTTGKEIKWEDSFTSRREAKLFDYWVISQVSAKAPYIFPGGFEMQTIEKMGPTSHYDLLPVDSGFEIVLNDDFGGHYFEEKVGTIKFSMIPREWLKSKGVIAKLIGDVSKNPKAPTGSPLVVPVTKDCQSDGVPQIICQSKLKSEFDQVRLVSQIKLEKLAGDQTATEGLIADDQRFIGDLIECANVKSCAETRLQQRLKELK